MSEGFLIPDSKSIDNVGERVEFSTFMCLLRHGAFSSDDPDNFPRKFNDEEIYLDSVKSRLMILLRLLNEESTNVEYAFMIDNLELELKEIYRATIELSERYPIFKFVDSLNLRTLLLEDDYSYWDNLFGNLVIQDWVEGYPVSNDKCINFDIYLIASLCLVLPTNIEFTNILKSCGASSEMMLNLIKHEIFRVRDEMEGKVYEHPVNLKKSYLEIFKVKMKRILTLPINI